MREDRKKGVENGVKSRGNKEGVVLKFGVKYGGGREMVCGWREICEMVKEGIEQRRGDRRGQDKLEGEIDVEIAG